MRRAAARRQMSTCLGSLQQRGLIDHAMQSCFLLQTTKGVQIAWKAQSRPRVLSVSVGATARRFSRVSHDRFLRHQQGTQVKPSPVCSRQTLDGRAREPRRPALPLWRAMRHGVVRQKWAPERLALCSWPPPLEPPASSQRGCSPL